MSTPETPLLTKCFALVVGYGAPVVPKGEMPCDEAAQRISYYRVSFDLNGRVVMVEKILRGERSFTYLYEYGPSGEVVEFSTIKEDGTVTVFRP